MIGEVDLTLLRIAAPVIVILLVGITLIVVSIGISPFVIESPATISVANVVTIVVTILLLELSELLVDFEILLFLELSLLLSFFTRILITFSSLFRKFRLAAILCYHRSCCRCYI